MQHIHAREHLHGGAVVRVDCDRQCNVMVMKDGDYSNYRRGGRFHYFGGFYRQFPTAIGVPETGDWNVVIDLGGGAANIRYGISYIN